MTDIEESTNLITNTVDEESTNLIPSIINEKLTDIISTIVEEEPPTPNPIIPEIRKDTDEIKQKLKCVLDRSKIIHKREILKLTTLKEAHIYCKINGLSGQISGPLIENFIKEKYGMTKNNASSCVGDLQMNETNLEIKVSNGGKDNNKFNYVQLRMNHVCDYILTAYYIDTNNLNDLGELFIFKLNKENIKQLILNYGGYAHGTVQKLGPITREELDNTAIDKEYAIRPKYGDKCWCDLLKFRVDDIFSQK